MRINILHLLLLCDFFLTQKTTWLNKNEKALKDFRNLSGLLLYFMRSSYYFEAFEPSFLSSAGF